MTRFERPVTPAEITAGLRALIGHLVSDGLPVYVNVQPIVDAQANECFPLVEQQTQQDGGQTVFGWSLWELPALFVEAEFHAVWKQPTGELLDVTPKNHATSKILFLPDPSRRYEGRQINNVRRALRTSPTLDAYLATFNAEFELMNRGERAWQHEVVLSGPEAVERESLLRRRAECYLHLFNAFPVIGPYHPCPCGSGNKVKWCHKQLGAG